MPVIIPKTLPAYDALGKENIFVMHEERATTQEIRPLRILILNLMPTKITTETQLARKLANTPLQVEITFLKTASYQSTHVSAAHLDAFYKTFDEIKDERFDGMIITGAPLEDYAYEEVAYWDEVCKILEYAKTNVYSTLFLCWGAFASLYYYYGVRNVRLPEKMFGVFKHRVLRKNNPLMRGFDDVFTAPHSRHIGLNLEDLAKATEVRILAEGEISGPHIMSIENGRQIFVLGHHEYDADTLDQEYRRDLGKGRTDVPIPCNYYEDDDPTKEPIVTWKANGSLLFSNWLNYYVYQDTPYDLAELEALKSGRSDENQG